MPTSHEMKENDSDQSTNSCVQSFDRKVETIDKFKDRRRHLHLRHLGGNPNNGKNDMYGKNEKIGTDGRNGRSEYRFPEPPSHFAIFFASQPFFFFCKISRTDISECRARDGQWRQIISPYAPQTHSFLVHATFHQRTCDGSR